MDDFYQIIHLKLDRYYGFLDVARKTKARATSDDDEERREIALAQTEPVEDTLRLGLAEETIDRHRRHLESTTIGVKT